MITEDSTLTRKSRTKIRKPKFLSLRLQLISAAPPPQPPPSPMPATTTLINLFPLHPENNQDDHNMAACIFSSCDDAATLTGILSSGEEEGNMDNPSPSSVNYADEEGELVKTAMRRRNKSGENRHEKWVVVEKKKGVIKGFVNSSLTASSSASSCDLNQDYYEHNRGLRRSKPVLKLDYEKIMETWVNKGPFCVDGNSDPGMDSSQPQTVPELQDDDDLFGPSSSAPNSKRHDMSNGGLWAVPEMARIENNDKGDETGGEATVPSATSKAMMHRREASVQRYKEKRRNRLFAKTIRYEVRKLNAEKRPRCKGRFVKRN